VKAVVIDRFGGPEVLQIREVETPRPGYGEVLVRLRASGVCYHDILCREGVMRRGIRFPRILGHEPAGEVAELGPGVRTLQVGDRVAATQRRSVCGQCRLCRTGHETHCPEQLCFSHEVDGSYAEYCIVGEDNVVKLPESISFAEGAMLSCAVGTLLNAIRDVGKVRPGEIMLVTGSGGGLGVHTLQLGRLFGAIVVAVTTSPEKAERLRDYGADHIVVAKDGTFAEEVRRVTGGRGADVAIDNVGSRVFHEVRQSLARRGRYVMVGELTGEHVTFGLAQLFLRGIDLLSVTSTARWQLQDVVDLIAAGKLTPVVMKTYPLDEVAQAHHDLETRRSFGRIALEM
jgi:NADPH:quinone reductase-like Zn-dependent oxidoreductase